MNKQIYGWLLSLVLLGIGVAGPAQAGDQLREVSLSASAEAAVAQDWLSMRFAVRRDGPNAAVVQADVKQALQDALASVQSLASGEALQVTTGAFNMHPRYNKAGAPMGWNGQAELVLSGKDFGRIGEASALLPTLAVQSVNLSVSSALTRTTRERVRLEAIAAFREQAKSVAQAFGYASYELLDVNVGGDQGGGRPPVMLARAMAMDAAPVPVAAGQETITVQVSGRIRLQ